MLFFFIAFFHFFNILLGDVPSFWTFYPPLPPKTYGRCAEYGAEALLNGRCAEYGAEALPNGRCATACAEAHPIPHHSQRPNFLTSFWVLLRPFGRFTPFWAFYRSPGQFYVLLNLSFWFVFLAVGGQPFLVAPLPLLLTALQRRFS